VVAVNKMDLVGYRPEVFSRIVDDFLGFAVRSGISDVRFVPISALDGDMVVDRGDKLPWYEGPTLLQILETAEVSNALENAAFRFPVQCVARGNGAHRRRYMGRIESGSIAIGDAVSVLPTAVPTQVSAIRTFAGTQGSAGLHAAVTLELADEIDISRGDMLARLDATPAIVRTVEADVCWLDERPLDPARKYLLRHTTREVRARIDRIDHLWNVTTQQREPAPATLQLNDIGHVAMTLAQPVFADRYADNRATGSFIVIDEATNNTVAAGMIR